MSDKLDIAGIERTAFGAAMAGFAPFCLFYELHDVWPGVPGRAYIVEMVRRTYGWDAVDYARTLPIYTQH